MGDKIATLEAQHDIFNNDDEYAIYVEKKKAEDGAKKDRINRILDEYSFK
jgi:hypothetical protein